MNNRPFIQHTIGDLRTLYEASKEDVGALRKLRAELKHRHVPKARALLSEVERRLDAFQSAKEENSAGHASDVRGEPPLTHKLVACVGCGVKLRVQLQPGTRTADCPKCGNEFLASYEDGLFTVVFERTKVNGEEKERITLDTAYGILGVRKSDPFDVIDRARKALIQRYHSDRVAHLGKKLQELAEAESTRINVAFDLIRRAMRQ